MSTRLACLLLLAACAEEVAPPPAPGAPFWADTRFLRDAAGAALLLRGPNVSQSAKAAPYHPKELEAGLELLDATGPHTLRYLSSWAAIEPTEGQYDEAYLDALRHRLAELAAHGHWIILDLHQDVFGVGFAGANGAPRWACEERYYASFVPKSPWFLGYYTDEVRACFDALFSNPARRARMAQALLRATQVAIEGAGDALVAVDLINEPFPGTASPAEFDAERLFPYYDAAAKALDGLGRVLLFEPNVLHNVGEPVRLPPWPHRAGAFAPHFYPLDAELGRYEGDAAAVDRAIDADAAEARALGVPLVIGEWGPLITDPKRDEYIDAVLGALDRHFAGALYWVWSAGSRGLVDADGKPTALATRALRPHARRVAGTPTLHRFDPATKVLELEYAETGAGGPTELVLPSTWYPDGFAIELSDGTSEASGNLVRVTHDPKIAAHRAIVRPR